jgi:hypothetical protein
VEVAVSFILFLREWGESGLMMSREEEDPDEYPFPLTLRTKRPTGPTSPAEPVPITNGDS